MESGNYSAAILMRLTHLPTLLLIIGYPIFWYEVRGLEISNGITTPTASILFLIISLFVLRKNFKGIVKIYAEFLQGFKTADNVIKAFYFLGIFFVVAGLAIGAYVSYLPPYLPQEFDALNYHYTLPRQHLIRHSFSFINWSSGDLFLFPIQFALSPYWFISELPNKIPQFIFFIGLILIAVDWVRCNTEKNQNAYLLIIFALMDTQGLTIQLGISMLDIVICYLFLAALDSLKRGMIGLSAIECAFLFWAKPFIPLQISVLLIAFAFLKFVLRKAGISITGFKLTHKQFIKFGIMFVITSLFIAKPFIEKSLENAGTPLYPFAPGTFKSKTIDNNPVQLEKLKKASKIYYHTKDAYGHGRSVKDFIKHFWIIAVPEKGVNNAYDYPLGLPYLLCLIPFIFIFIKQISKKELNILSVLIVLLWGMWWFASQQARFLYVPVVLMFIAVISEDKFRTKIFLLVMTMAVFINFISIIRSHKKSFLISHRSDVMRPEDKRILKLNKEYIASGEKGQYIDLDKEDYDSPYALFPFNVRESKYPFVIGING